MSSDEDNISASASDDLESSVPPFRGWLEIFPWPTVAKRRALVKLKCAPGEYRLWFREAIGRDGSPVDDGDPVIIIPCAYGHRSREIHIGQVHTFLGMNTAEGVTSPMAVMTSNEDYYDYELVAISQSRLTWTWIDFAFANLAIHFRRRLHLRRLLQLRWQLAQHFRPQVQLDNEIMGIILDYVMGAVRRLQSAKLVGEVFCGPERVTLAFPREWANE